MIKAAIPANESARLQSLQRYEILDTAPGQEFDDITHLASEICGTPIAMISLVDANRQWFKSKVGTTTSETPRDISFCAHGILQTEVFVVNDARTDERFADNPLVTGESQVRFYAGAPLITSDGHALGMLCVNDKKARQITESQKRSLQALGRQVVAQLELRRHVKELQQTIADRQLAEAELVRERNLLCALMDNSDDSIYFKDKESRFIRCSTKMAGMFRSNGVEGLIGHRDSDFFATEHALEAFADEQEIIRTGQPMMAKIEKETWPDGRVTWALTSKMPLRSRTGEIIGTFGISKDITAIKNAEEKLDQVHRQLMDASRQAGMAEVATNVLHNVGNVLNSVNVSSSLIADKVRASRVVNLGKVAELIRSHSADLAGFFTSDTRGKQLPGYLSGLAANLAQEQEDILHEVGSLVNNIVHIKEIVAMQQSYAKAFGVQESIQVAELVEDAARMNSGAMARHNVKIVREFKDVAPILTEKHKVLQILVNLIRNAKYACDDSGREDKQITLRVANGDGRIKISVIDNGVGIPPENLTRIFNHGFTTKKDGHGFGLHSGALAAKELGGALTAFSRGVGLGAAFTLELPVKR